MILTVGSYNIWLGKAFRRAGELAQTEAVDVLCLQECKEDQLTPSLGSLVLAGAAQLDQTALALYYNPRRLTLKDYSAHKLPAAWYERNKMHNRARLQLARFTVANSETTLVVGNLHLANMSAPNLDRRKQLLAALEITNDFRAEAPAMLAGDTNYPFFERGLDRIVTGVGFRELGKATTGKTHTSKLAKNKLDRIFVSEGAIEVEHTILPISVSDHAAVIAQIEI